MDVRCLRCRRAVSEWAARCPFCRGDLAHAEPIDDVGPPEGWPPPAAPPGLDKPVRGSGVANATGAAFAPGGPVGGPEAAVVGSPVAGSPVAGGTSPRRRVALAAALVVGVGLAGGGVALTHGRHVRRPAAVASKAAPVAVPARRGPMLPSMSSVVGAAAERLRSQQLFIADGRSAEAVLADGTVLQRLGPSVGTAEEPVSVGDNTVVYTTAGEAYAFDLSTGANPVLLGAAQQIFSAGLGRVDLVAPSGDEQKVTLISIGDGPSSDTYAVAGSNRIVGASVDGLLVEGSDRVIDLMSSVDGTTEAVTGPVSHVVAVSGDELAWTSVAGCALALTSDCPLHLTNLRTRVDRLVDPSGAIGFAGIGAFSPDGRYLAVYDLSGRPQVSPRLGLELVRTSTGASRALGSVLVAGSVTPTVTWSPGGEWLFFGGSGSFDALDFAPVDPASAPTQPVPLPLSVNCCVVAF